MWRWTAVGRCDRHVRKRYASTLPCSQFKVQSVIASRVYNISRPKLRAVLCFYSSDTTSAACRTSHLGTNSMALAVLAAAFPHLPAAVPYLYVLSVFDFPRCSGNITRGRTKRSLTLTAPLLVSRKPSRDQFGDQRTCVRLLGRSRCHWLRDGRTRRRWLLQ